ncbi:MAG TPA: hypothetical protein VJH37_04960 [Candidatus Nanoarchaeia archaeon]|nr:hypothetical protein [Candidatus Nanoarchaeia archaeon]
MIVGFHFTKLLVERHQPISGKISVRNDLNIRDVQERSLSTVKSSHKTVAFQFVFSVTYSPHIADVTIIGDVLYSAEPKKIEEILSQWKTKKKVAADISIDVLNLVLQKCNIRALEMAQELNLPTHIPMPKVNFQKKTADAYIG